MTDSSCPFDDNDRPLLLFFGHVPAPRKKASAYRCLASVLWSLEEIYTLEHASSISMEFSPPPRPFPATATITSSRGTLVIQALSWSAYTFAAQTGGHNGEVATARGDVESDGSFFLSGAFVGLLRSILLATS